MLEIEPGLKKVKGYVHLAEFRSSMEIAAENKQNKYDKKVSAL